MSNVKKSRLSEYNLSSSQKILIFKKIYNYNKCTQITSRAEALEVFRIKNPLK